MITYTKKETYNPIRSPNRVISYIVKLDGKTVGTIKYKAREGWRYHPRGGKPGEAFVNLNDCKRSLETPPSEQTADKLDSLLSRAFKETEGELAVALVEAEKALESSLKCKPHHEIIAELSGALRRLCDLLGSKSSN